MEKQKRISIQNITKLYHMGDTTVEALRGISFDIEHGELVSITGSSGSGKSTLMHLIGCLDVPTTGIYLLDGENVAHLNRNQLARIRNKKIGFIFQKFHLLSDLSATENVALPCMYAGASEKEGREKALFMIEKVGLKERAGHYPYQLSGGQQQRVAIARSLINDPSIILADEPTGNLDTATGNEIVELFKKLNAQTSTTIIVVTHSPELAAQTRRNIDLRDGRIVADKELLS